MKIKFQNIIIGLTLMSCSESLDNLSGRNLYSYTDKREFFPNEVIQNKRFYSDWFVAKLKQLDEKSLSDKYRGHEIVRLTAIRSFKNHFTISIERTDNGVHLTEKETYRDSRQINNGDSTKVTYDIIEFDSLSGKYTEVRKYMPVGTRTGPTEIEITRKPVDPLLNNKSKEIRRADWNNLADLLGTTSFFEMPLVDTTRRGFDGDYYILETHSKNGYYVAERWSPRDGDFKKYIDYIIGLSDFKREEN